MGVTKDLKIPRDCWGFAWLGHSKDGLPYQDLLVYTIPSWSKELGEWSEGVGWSRSARIQWSSFLVEAQSRHAWWEHCDSAVQLEKMEIQRNWMDCQLSLKLPGHPSGLAADPSRGVSGLWQNLPLRLFPLPWVAWHGPKTSSQIKILGPKVFLTLSTAAKVCSLLGPSTKASCFSLATQRVASIDLSDTMAETAPGAATKLD